MSWTQTRRLRSWGEQNDRRMIIGYQNSVYGKMSKASKEIAMAIEMKSPERQSRTYHGLSGRVRETSMELKENPRRKKKPTEASIPTWNFRILITCGNENLKLKQYISLASWRPSWRNCVVFYRVLFFILFFFLKTTKNKWWFQFFSKTIFYNKKKSFTIELEYEKCKSTSF